MFDSKADRLTGALQSFLASSPDVEAVAVVSFDGLVMAAALPDELEEDRVGAMSAALLGLGEQAVKGLGCGQLNQLFVEGDEGFVFLMSARDQAVLAAVTSRAAKVGFVLFEMRRAAEAVGLILEDATPPAPVLAPFTPAPLPHVAPAAPADVAPLPDAPRARTALFAGSSSASATGAARDGSADGAVGAGPTWG